MRGANIFAGIVCALWLGLVWLGIDGMRGVVNQHAPGYPSPGQLAFYVGAPAVVACGLVLWAILCNLVWRSATALGLVSVLALLFLPLYLLPYGGGV